MAKKKPSIHNSILGAGGGGGAGITGRVTAGQAKSRQSGADLAKNFRASGRAGLSTNTKPQSGKTYNKTSKKSSGILKFLGF